MKKLFGLLLGIMFTLSASNVSAMTFSQPIKIGTAFITTMGIFEITGAVQNIGKGYTNRKFIDAYNLQGKNGVTIFDSGVARFISGKDEIYFHYDSRNGNTGLPITSRFGGRNIENTVNVGTGVPGYIRMIKSDDNVTLYLLSFQNNMTRFSGYNWGHTLIGKRKDGIFVQFFDTVNLSKRFFGNPSIKNTNYTDCVVKGDTISVKYKYGKDLSSKKADISGEFHFKWDDAAQWFGVEQIVY